jgi:hypothetical protein
MTYGSDRCSVCGHAIHGNGVCYNMASDNDCICKGPVEKVPHRPRHRLLEPGWHPWKWQELVSDTNDGDPIGDRIRLSWSDGTVLVGRLTVGPQGSGRHQILRMQTTFGGDTYVYSHGARLERWEPDATA